MNASFEKNSTFNSNSRIFDAYFVETAQTASMGRRAVDTLSACVASARSIWKYSAISRILRAVGVAASLVGFVGIIGAMERGTLGLGAGLVMGLLLMGMEYLCLRKSK